MTYVLIRSLLLFTVDDNSFSSDNSSSSWISWFLASKGNEYFCEIDDEYILDRFNLTGLNAEVQGYSGALELITDTAGEPHPLFLNSGTRKPLTLFRSCGS